LHRYAASIISLEHISGVVPQMYENAAMLAAFLLVYSAIAGRVERSWISGPIVFTGVGFILGPDGVGLLRINISGEGLHLLAELTLAMVLFTDAANADFGVVGATSGSRSGFC
jgi:hypothetical protein